MGNRSARHAAARWRRGVAQTSLSVAISAVLLSGCGFAASVSTSATTPRADIATATPEPTATATATATIAPTATAVPPTPTATPQADAMLQQWRSNAARIATIDGSLVQLGNQFNSGSVSLQAGANQLQELDMQASAVRQEVAALPAPPDSDSSALARYRQTVDLWSADIHNLDVAVANDNIFAAPGLATQLEDVGADLERQGAALRLTGQPAA